MTSELEQEFFKAFEIDEQCICPYFPEYMENGCEICIKYFQGKKDCNEKNQYKYPEITTEKLLPMICILNKHYAENFQCATMLVGDTIEKIKECVLKDCIEQSQHIKTEIQQLFKGK